MNKEKFNIMICRRNVMLTHQTHHEYAASAPRTMMMMMTGHEESSSSHAHVHNK